MWRQLRIAALFLLVFSVITGVIYPAVVTGVAQVLFHYQANGSMISAGGQVLGSELIGQPFSDPRYFWGRLSSTPSFPFNASASSGSNLGPSNPAMLAAVQARIDALKSVDPNNDLPIPVDLVTASGSGLDPDISPAAAQYQAGRVARVRGLSVATVMALVDKHVQGRQFGIFGEPRVNVLELDLALDGLTVGT
jgi:potassium-transporting ATPase KdpC subunit